LKIHDWPCAVGHNTNYKFVNFFQKSALGECNFIVGRSGKKKTWIMSFVYFKFKYWTTLGMIYQIFIG